MVHRRSRLPWVYDDELQEFHTAAGIVTLTELAALRAAHLQGRFTLPAPWIGWRVSGDTLTAPGGVRLKPDTARLFWQWLQAADTYSRPGPQRPQLRIVK